MNYLNKGRYNKFSIIYYPDNYEVNFYLNKNYEKISQMYGCGQFTSHFKGKFIFISHVIDHIKWAMFQPRTK